MAMLECKDEPGYAAVCFAVHSCLTAVQLDMIQSMMYNNILLNPIPPTCCPVLMLSTHANAVLLRSVLLRSASVLAPLRFLSGLSSQSTLWPLRLASVNTASMTKPSMLAPGVLAIAKGVGCACRRP
jgi:hypothetical protein